MNIQRRPGYVVVVAALGALLLALSACSSSSSPSSSSSSPSGAAKKGKIAIVFDGSITDKGFNQSVYEAAKAEAAANGLGFAYTDQVKIPSAVETLGNYARQGYHDHRRRGRVDAA
jgi:basic membrane lipoprotein Med (substrate-binding protein (PBP1-ABC) superfamily)